MCSLSQSPLGANVEKAKENHRQGVIFWLPITLINASGNCNCLIFSRFLFQILKQEHIFLLIPVWLQREFVWKDIPGYSNELLETMSHEVFRKHTNNVHSLGFFVRADATIDLRKHEQMLFCTLYISESLEIHEVFCRFYESSNNPAAVQFRTTKMSSDVRLNLRAQKAALEQPALLTGLQDVVWKGQPGPALNAATFLTRPSQLPRHSFCNPVA